MRNILTTLFFLISASAFGSSFQECKFKIKVLKKTNDKVDIKLIASIPTGGSLKPVRSEDCKKEPLEESIKAENILAGKELAISGALLVGVRTYYSARGENGPLSGVSWEFSRK